MYSKSKLTLLPVNTKYKNTMLYYEEKPKISTKTSTHKRKN